MKRKSKWVLISFSGVSESCWGQTLHNNAARTSIRNPWEEIVLSGKNKTWVVVGTPKSMSHSPIRVRYRELNHTNGKYMSQATELKKQNNLSLLKPKSQSRDMTWLSQETSFNIYLVGFSFIWVAYFLSMALFLPLGIDMYILLFVLEVYDLMCDFFLKRPQSKRLPCTLRGTLNIEIALRLWKTIGNFKDGLSVFCYFILSWAFRRPGMEGSGSNENCPP